ncbi:MAG TPA: HAMP domain-containing sensor histidine kinase [Polyangiaceae bacterium]|nr:HAMP domain-containing sensor histidine kinase [Polyangiaceae bacterium]
MLHEFLTANRAAIVARTRAKVAARPAPRPTEDELEHGIPLFLDQFIETLRLSQSSSGAMDESATLHGRELLKMGFTVAQVVQDYGGLCQAVTELASETKATITVDEFHEFNRCLDGAIAQAVTEYTRTREQAIVDEGSERLGNLSHELRNALGAAMLSFQTLKAGNVGLGGSTAALLDRSLRRACALIDSSVAQVRLESGSRVTERVSMHEFIEEIEVSAAMEASAHGLTLAVTPVASGIDVAVDRQLLAGAVVNLLQNAFKFTRPAGHVSLMTSVTRDRVLVAIEDQCGGLPPGKAEELFRPFEQQSTDRRGLGLGLSISRRSVEAIGGELRVRDIPGVGCVFSVGLPRLSPD